MLAQNSATRARASCFEMSSLHESILLRKRKHVFRERKSWGSSTCRAEEGFSEVKNCAVEPYGFLIGDLKEDICHGMNQRVSDEDLCSDCLISVVSE